MASKAKAEKKPVEQTTPPPETWTINGVPVSSLPAHVQTALPYMATDQYQAERAQRDDVRPGRSIEVSDPIHRMTGHMEDDVNYDPYSELVRPLQEARPELKFRVMSPRVVNKRSLRGYEPVRDEKGDLVQIGNMFVGAMPKDVADRRARRFRKLAEESVAKSVEEYKEKTERIIGDSKSQGLSVLQAGEMMQDHRNPGRVATTGLSHSFGQ